MKIKFVIILIFLAFLKVEFSHSQHSTKFIEITKNLKPIDSITKIKKFRKGGVKEISKFLVFEYGEYTYEIVSGKQQLFDKKGRLFYEVFYGNFGNLIYQKQFIFSAILNLCIIFITLSNFSTNLYVTIPTPFNKKPFEFTVGFRKTFFIFPIAYFLTYISVSVGNFNLGVFSMLLIGLTCFSYYSKIENEYFVWNYNLSSKEFLIEKTKTCLIYFTILSLPVIITLSISFFREIDILIIFILLCYAYLTAIVLAKYSSFPNEMNMSQGILIAISFMFPPILLVFIPLFYSQSVKKLNTVLQ